ncbi:MAG: hypothetical protein AAFN07_14435 [Pseudomonadota bacterium]
MKIAESKKFAMAVTLAFAPALLLAVVSSSIDQRWADGVLTGDEMYGYEIPVFVLGIGAIFANLVAVLGHAFSTGNKGWGLLSLLFWPFSFVYVWMSATGKFKEKVSPSAA